MGHLGFSYVGLVFLLMLALPNIIWMKQQRQVSSAQRENRVLLLCERLGQVLVTGSALIFTDFNLRLWSIWTLWLIAAVVLMLMYEGWWVRYFKSQRSMADFYGSFCGIPVAGASLPVAAFFLLGVYGKVPLLMLSAVIFGFGHIGIHLRHRDEATASHESPQG